MTVTGVLDPAGAWADIALGRVAEVYRSTAMSWVEDRTGTRPATRDTGAILEPLGVGLSFTPMSAYFPAKHVW